MQILESPAPRTSHQKRHTINSVKWLHGAIEAVLLILVAASPWAFACVHPYFEMWLFAGVALLTLVWAALILVNRQVTWKPCPVAVCLIGLFLFGIFQLLPLPQPLLRILSPGTALLNEQLRPQQPEQLPFGEAPFAQSIPSFGALSLYPNATRDVLLRLLAVLALFAVVRNTIASPKSFRRLAMVGVINGVLLSVFALIQFFSSTPTRVYWRFETAGQVFGPFINRNHFPFYINLCIGMGAGLLFGATMGRRQRYRGLRTAGITDLLQDTPVLWIVAGVALMAATALFSLSRGGAAALLGAALCCLLIRWFTAEEKGRLVSWLVIGILVLGLLGWFGMSRVENRLASLWQGQALQESRLSIWRSVWPRVAESPIFGTGYGTFRYVESLGRQPGDHPDEYFRYAHNEYLEALLEGGFIRLSISIIAVALLLWVGYRGYRRGLQRSAGGLALGGLLAIGTVLIHSFVDFGLHIPAIAMLATVIAAQLAALGAWRGTVASSTNPESRRITEGTVRLGGPAPALAATGLAAVAFVLVSGGWQSAQAERFRLAAEHLEGSDKAPAREQQISYLQAAVALRPSDAELRVALAEALHRAYHEAVGRQQKHAKAGAVGQVTAFLAHSLADISPVSPVTPAIAAGMTSFTYRRLSQHGEMDRIHRHLQPALKQYVTARDLCPVLPRPHVRLAAFADKLVKSDSRTAYLRRAVFVRPLDAKLWYLLGKEQYQHGHAKRAWRSWKQSLLLSDQFFDKVLSVCAK